MPAKVKWLKTNLGGTMISVTVAFSGVNIESGKHLEHQETQCFLDDLSDAQEEALKRMRASFKASLWQNTNFRIVE